LNTSRSSPIQLKVTVFPPLAKLVNGELSPLHGELTTSYDHDLQLAPKAVQQLDVGAHTIARFQIGEQGCSGNLIRGYTFQRYAAMDGGRLHKYPMVFYAVKRLEQFFINRATDPMYIELTQLLEKASELLAQNHPEAEKYARASLERGQLALEQIFTDDKFVQLLINNLENSLALKARETGDRKWQKLQPLDL
jgi:hypothetical protein